MAVSELHACAGAKPRNAARACSSYGICASISSREPPGTRSSSPTAPLPPPVIASAALRPDACNVEINCCHAASDGLMVVWSEAEKYLANGERPFGQSQQSALACQQSCWRAESSAGFSILVLLAGFPEADR